MSIPAKDGDEIQSETLHPHKIRVSGVGGYSNVEMVPTHEINKYATQETSPEHAEEVAKHVVHQGMDPLILNYDHRENKANLGEGNHRLRVANRLGMSHVPVRVQRGYLNGPGTTPPHAHPAIDKGEHVPAEIKPSDIGIGEDSHHTAVKFQEGQNYTFEHRYHPRSDEHSIIAHHPDAPSDSYNNHAGHLTWFADNGEIGGVHVNSEHRRKGLATEMFNRAKEIQPDLHHSDALTPDGKAWSSKVGHKLAYGETKAPADVDTLRDPNCPVCGDDAFDGAECSVCGFVQPPAFLRDPDLNKAQQMDLRKNVAEQNPDDPNGGLQQEPGQPNDMVDPDQVNADGSVSDGGLGTNQPNDDGSASGQQITPGTLPGEVQAEVRPGDDDAQETPLEPAMGPDGTPVGPQDLPPSADDPAGKPFTPGPDAPDGPGNPDGPGMSMMDNQVPDTQDQEQDAASGLLTCNNCGFQAGASSPDSFDLENPEGGGDGTVAGDVCPNCGGGQLLSDAEMGGGAAVPPPA